MTGSKLTEDDFNSTIDNGVEIPIIEIGEGDYIVAYGHLDKEEFLGYCNQYYKYTTGSDPECYLDDDDEVFWTWARRTDSRQDDEWYITWTDVNPTDDDSFPITVVNTW
jgi:hypothetical protein